MVLIHLWFLVLFPQPEQKLLSIYENKISQWILKESDFGKKTTINFLPFSSNADDIEYYLIKINEENIGRLFLKEVKACNLNGCSALVNDDSSQAGKEYFDLAVITNLNDQIQSIKVLDYFSDYGYEISSKAYLNALEGKNLCQWSEDEIEVDGITGATISVNALHASLSDFCFLAKR